MFSAISVATLGLFCAWAEGGAVSMVRAGAGAGAGVGEAGVGVGSAVDDGMGSGVLAVLENMLTTLHEFTEVCVSVDPDRARKARAGGGQLGPRRIVSICNEIFLRRKAFAADHG
jgi:hypothetical protein